MEDISAAKLCPNLIVFAWDVLTSSHEMVYDDPEASIVDINNFIDDRTTDTYYAIYKKNIHDDIYGVIAIIPGKNLSEGSKILGFTAMPTAQYINGSWWFQ